MVLEEIRRRAEVLGIEQAERMQVSELVRRIQSREGDYPCFDQQWCRPGQHHRCRWKADCHAQLEPVRGLVLSDHVIIGHQVASLFQAEYGWQMQVMHRDREAYGLILQGHMDVVIADIDAVDLGGLAVLAYARHHWSSIMTYGITAGQDAYLMQLAQDMGGCRGFFHVGKGRLELDAGTGMAARLVRRNAYPSPASHAVPAV